MKPRITDEYKSYLKDLLNRALEVLSNRDVEREEIIKISREIIRCSGKTITLIVAGDVESGLRVIRSCRDLVDRLLEIYRREPDLVRGGIALQSLVEFCEATTLIRSVVDIEIDCPSDIIPEALILGVLDMTGELRRIAVRLLGEWDLERSRDIIDLMKEIYDTLSHIDLPDAIAPGYRHKIDVLRRNIEDLETLYSDIKTRRDLIDSVKRTDNT
ncbi:MAG: hypothetical protein ABWJ42_07170 [Sulfolobales archaeon]